MPQLLRWIKKEIHIKTEVQRSLLKCNAMARSLKQNRTFIKIGIIDLSIIEIRMFESDKMLYLFELNGLNRNKLQ